MSSAVCSVLRLCGCFFLFLCNVFAVSVASETTFTLHSSIPAIMHVFNLKIATEIISYQPLYLSLAHTDRFDSIFHHRNWRAKVSYGVDIINQ